MKINIKGKEVLIDSRDISIYQSRVWHISDTGYVVWRGKQNGIKKTIRMHRLIIGAKDGEIVDHINRNKLDNRRSNLHIVTQRENVHNSDRYDAAKGYYFDNRKQRWAVDSKRLGVRSVYLDSEDGAKRYIKSLKNGEIPVREFTKKKTISNAKLTEKIMISMEILHRKGLNYRSIARRFGISESSVGRYFNGKTWVDERSKIIKKNRCIITKGG